MLISHYFEPWQSYQNPLVRQLAFAIASPNLIRNLPSELQSFNQNIQIHNDLDWQQYYLAYVPRLVFLDKHPQELIQFLAQIKSTRLGLRFEALLWFWLQDPQNQFFDLLGHSIQSHHAGKTLGEIDFLLQSKLDRSIIHWEVCLKYYLAKPSLQLSTWIGLNPNDTLLQKLQHLIAQQFQFKTAIDHTIEKRYLIIKGQLYLPQTHQALPEWLNHHRRLGYWLGHIPQTGQWRRLQRQEWLCPHHSKMTGLPTLIHWWTDGLYYDAQNMRFLMLYLQNKLSLFL